MSLAHRVLELRNNHGLQGIDTTVRHLDRLVCRHHACQMYTPVLPKGPRMPTPCEIHRPSPVPRPEVQPFVIGILDLGWVPSGHKAGPFSQDPTAWWTPSTTPTCALGMHRGYGVRHAPSSRNEVWRPASFTSSCNALTKAAFAFSTASPPFARPGSTRSLPPDSVSLKHSKSGSVTPAMLSANGFHV